MFVSLFFFFFNDTATTEIYTLSLHDALPIFAGKLGGAVQEDVTVGHGAQPSAPVGRRPMRSEEHTSELQSQSNLVCRLLLEKKKTRNARESRTANTNDHRHHASSATQPTWTP